MKALFVRSSAAFAFFLFALALPAAAQDTTTSAPPPPPDASQEDVPTEDARQAAEDWLAYIDEKDIAQGYENAATVMKDQVPQEQWTQQIQTARSQTGALESREFSTARSVPSPPNDPEGQYVAVLYDATYENLPQAQETVVLIDEDGTWKVAGYVVQPARSQGASAPQQQNSPAPEDQPQPTPQNEPPAPQPQPTPEPETPPNEPPLQG